MLIADRIRITRTWNHADVCSASWRLYVDSRSGAAVRWAGGLHALDAGRIHLVLAWVRFTCVNRTPIDHFYIHFDVIGWAGTLVRDLFPRPLAIAHDRECERRAAALSRDLGAGDLAPVVRLTRCKALIHDALAAALAALPRPAQDRCLPPGRRGRVGPALDHIERHLARPIANAHLAGLCGLGEDRFIRVFRAELAQTPAQHIPERRIGAASRMLVMDDRSIDDIALACGFPDRFYFTRVFTAVMGVPPAAYRASNRMGESRR